MSKGQISVPLTITESVMTFLVILGLLSGVVIETGDFIAEKTVDLQVERINNAALALDSVSEGHLEIELDAKKSYYFRYSQGKISLNYSSKVKSLDFSDSLAQYDVVRGPNDFTKVDKNLCLKKLKEEENTVLEFKPEGCDNE